MSRKRKRKRTGAGSSSRQDDRARASRDAPDERRSRQPSDGKSQRNGEEAAAMESGGRHRTGYDHVRENLEALIVAIILAVIIRQFAVEAFEIPTGSMDPTLYGIHAWTDCPNCGTDYNIALRTDSDTGEITVKYFPRIIYEGPCQNPAGCGMDRHFQNSLGADLQKGETIRCTACGYKFRGELSRYREAAVHEYRSRCPICQFRFEDIIESSNVTGGHKILVDKFAYAIGEPERWDVIVFTFDQWKNYIKRLVGRPGEKIDLWDGDVYVNGQIERKYRHPYIQDVLWVKIADSSVAERGLRDDLPPAWKELAPKDSGRDAVENMLASWNDATRRWSVNATGDAAILEYQRGFDNYYPYNLLTYHDSGIPSNVQVGDKKVEFVVNPVTTPPASSAVKRIEGSWVGAEIRDGDFTFQVRIPVTDGAAPGAKAVLRRVVNESTDAEGRKLLPDPDPPSYVDPPLEATKEVAIRRDRAAHVAFENVDDGAMVYLDGELILQLEYRSLPEEVDFMDPTSIRPSYMPSEDRAAHFIRLIVADASVELSDIRVYRDMYYIGEFNERGLGGQGYRYSSIQLREGQYFALGDNGPSSSDGRIWGFVPESHMMGKAFAVFWPAWPTNFQCKFIR